MELFVVCGASVIYNDNTYDVCGPREILAVTDRRWAADALLDAHRDALVESWDPSVICGCRGLDDLVSLVATHTAVYSYEVEGAPERLEHAWLVVDLYDGEPGLEVDAVHGVYAHGRDAADAVAALGRARLAEASPDDTYGVDYWSLLTLRAVAQPVVADVADAIEALR